MVAAVLRRARGAGGAGRRGPSEAASIADLEEWTRQNFPGAARTHAWSAQDYEPVSGVPLVRRMPATGGRVHVASGYDKWGMTNAVAAALAVSSDILGGRMRWAQELYRHGVSPADVGEALGAGTAVARHLVVGWWRALRAPRRCAPPVEGCAAVTSAGVRPVGTSRVDGEVCSVVAVCPHMGSVLSWNDAARSWDCPLHGSRFSASGTRLEGPAVRDLRRVR